MKGPANPHHPFPSTMHCPHGEHALKHLGGGAFGTACQVCNPDGDLVAVLRNSPEVDAIVEKQLSRQDCEDLVRLGRGEKRPYTSVLGVVTEAQLEKLGHLVDRIDNLVHAGAIPMPDKLRATALAEALPDLHSELKTLYVEIAGEDPWADVEEGIPPAVATPVKVRQHIPEFVEVRTPPEPVHVQTLHELFRIPFVARWRDRPMGRDFGDFRRFSIDASEKPWCLMAEFSAKFWVVAYLEGEESSIRALGLPEWNTQR